MSNFSENIHKLFHPSAKVVTKESLFQQIEKDAEMLPKKMVAMSQMAPFRVQRITGVPRLMALGTPSKDAVIDTANHIESLLAARGENKISDERLKELREGLEHPEIPDSELFKIIFDFKSDIFARQSAKEAWEKLEKCLIDAELEKRGLLVGAANISPQR